MRAAPTEVGAALMRSKGFLVLGNASAPWPGDLSSASFIALLLSGDHLHALSLRALSRRRHLVHVLCPGFTGPVTLDMSQAPVADYSIEVSTADQYQADVYFWTEQFTYDGTTDEISFTLPDSITDLGKYRVAIWPTGSPSQEGRASSSFWVLKPLRLSKEGTSALPFYPLVRDGYRDQATSLRLESGRGNDREGGRPRRFGPEWLPDLRNLKEPELLREPVLLLRGDEPGLLGRPVRAGRLRVQGAEDGLQHLVPGRRARQLLRPRRHHPQGRPGLREAVPGDGAGDELALLHRGAGQDHLSVEAAHLNTGAGRANESMCATAPRASGAVLATWVGRPGVRRLVMNCTLVVGNLAVRDHSMPWLSRSRHDRGRWKWS